MSSLHQWYANNGWQPFPFQEEAWTAYLAGKSGLIHAPTGAGKTMAAWGGPIVEYLEHQNLLTATPPHYQPLTVLWLTPLRALANDTVESLREPIKALNLPWSVELRTGDTPQSVRAKQRKQLPTVLITTPESLSLLLSQSEVAKRFAKLKLVVVDEWHELLGSKRGVQTELCLAHLRSLAPELRTWGLSATLGNIEQAMNVLLGPPQTGPPKPSPRPVNPGRMQRTTENPCSKSECCSGGVLIRGMMTKRIELETLLPPDVERFPWAGHLGIKLLPQLLDAIEQAKSSLVFTNTRSQTEIWFREILKARPDWLETIGIHHGSIDRDVRERVEQLLREGRLRAVVCTSSLDLGVDFSPVDQVVQIGSPKGIARLMQRAGRSGHQPGAVSRVVGLPTNALELVEFAAARDAIEIALSDEGCDQVAKTSIVEMREPLDRPFDVLVQHLVTIAMGDGFTKEVMLEEIRSTHAYQKLSDEEWQWAIDFITHGGDSLRAYPQYARVTLDETGKYRVDSKQVARLHRMSIGTITSVASMRVKLLKGATLGTIEEGFINRLRPGDRFFFAGRMLELVRVRNMTATVKVSSRKSSNVPRWAGGRSPLSTQLADRVRLRLDAARQGQFIGPEMNAVKPLLELQSRWSKISKPGELLIERSRDRRVQHVFVFSFAGRLVHEGLAALVGHRATQQRALSLELSGNDYGFELSSRDPLAFSEDEWRLLLSPDNLLDDLLACLNSTELTRTRFRSIAQVAGLIFPGYPGQQKRARHLQASSDLFFDVFQEFDVENLLLDQSRREVLERELEFERLQSVLQRLASETITIIETERFSPLAFPLWVESLRSQQISSETWADRVQQMVAELEEAAGVQAR